MVGVRAPKLAGVPASWWVSLTDVVVYSSSSGVCWFFVVFVYSFIHHHINMMYVYFHLISDIKILILNEIMLMIFRMACLIIRVCKDGHMPQVRRFIERGVDELIDV